MQQVLPGLLEALKAVTGAEGFPAHVFNAALHVTFFVAPSNVAEPESVAVMATELLQGKRWLSFLVSNELRHCYAHIVVDHLVKHPFTVSKEGNVGFQESQRVLSAKQQGKAVVAVTAGEHGQIQPYLPASYFESDFCPVKLTTGAWLILLTDENLHCWLCFGPQVVADSSVADLKAFFLQGLMDILLEQYLFAQPLLLFLLVLLPVLIKSLLQGLA